MAKEAIIRCSIQITKVDTTTGIVHLQYDSKPSSFFADVAGQKGPVPGAFTASTAGTDVDFSELTQPGLCRIMNQDSTNFVEWGPWDPQSMLFYPVGELLPGETFPFRISRHLTGEFGTGPGTVGANSNTLRFKANTAACQVLVEAFEV